MEKMKKTLKGSLIVLLWAICLWGPACQAAEEETMRGVWISTVANLDYPSSQGLSKAELTAELDEMLDTMEQAGLNAAFFQVRPCADSFYPSKIFPYSVYFTGEQGQPPAESFDPLAYLVEQAHARGIQVHAWVNPYRITQNSPGSWQAGMEQLAEWHPARQRPELVRLYQGNLYFDPGQPAARELIVQGVQEILDNYPVDGVHIDDYFYPGQEFDDGETYAAYGAGLSLEDFRRQSVNDLVRQLSQAARGAGRQFGAAPFGIWANASSMEGGSDTQGTQSYSDHYADSLKWMQEGWLDYIAPQLYWYSGQPEADFTKLLEWWSNQAEATGCRLCPGIAAYKAMGGDQAEPWQGCGEIENQLRQMAAEPQCQGCLFFRYGILREHPPLLAAASQAFPENGENGPIEEEGRSVGAGQKLAVSRPEDLVRTDLDCFYFCGLSDPSQPLTVNGQLVQSRAADGSWGVLLPLEQGFNTFVVENGQDKVVRRLLRGLPTQYMGEAWPEGDTYLPQGEKARLSLEGRSGGQAWALFCGEALPLIYQDGQYQGECSLPGGARGQITRYGPPLYVMRRGDFVSVSLAQGGLYQIGPGAALDYTVKTDLCDVLIEADASQGSCGVLRQGMTGPAERVENGYILAQDLGYLRLEDADLSLSRGDAQVLPSGCQEEEECVRLRFSSDRALAAKCAYENSQFVLTFPGAASKYPLSGDLFGQTGAQIQGDSLVYTFTLKNIQPAGFYFEQTDQGAELIVRAKAQPAQGLEGVTILLDPGHGGGQTGALGCDPGQPEKQVNLRMAQALEEKLTALGAQVEMTRQKDGDVSLNQRYRQSFRLMPDLFLSLHCNSAPDDTDISTAAGFTAYCQGDLAQPLAQSLAQAAEETGRAANPAVDDSRLYLCRQSHTAAILLENGYLPNPFEFSDIVSDQSVDQLTQALAQAILEYYSPQPNPSF